MQTIISQYYIELIGLIVAVTLITIVILLKSSKGKAAESAKEEQTEAPKSDKKEAEPSAEVIEEKEEPELKEEPQQLQETPSAPVETAAPVPTNRKKRELIPHGKITKDDFEDFKGTRVLIAEDNIINQKVIMGLLSTSGIDITIANDGQEALNILENDRDFAVIFMDAHMPVVDGFQATRIIRKNPNYEHIPIVALSGDTAADDVRNMLNVGMEAHLEKPLKMDALYDILYIYTTGEELQKTASAVSQESAEFDIHKGLEICGGDREFYLEILNDFLSKYSDSEKTLQEHINGTNGIDADKLLLDISGVAANIGADNLHDAALELKKSIANPSDLSYVSDLKKYKRALERVCEAIKEYMAA
ncbi:response regulator [Sulfurimonas sp.]|jgi:CheY-like chemotaxis protein|uniref:response regulator n=1 Tax=Sulfurimonas sp. TaxID=2022749 RepID=UPI002A361657|nr:response regulator [Sulfurimonas sp.]MDY0124494.1 response regulator [Sulfurimonas sp.]